MPARELFACLSDQLRKSAREHARVAYGPQIPVLMHQPLGLLLGQAWHTRLSSCMFPPAPPPHLTARLLVRGRPNWSADVSRLAARLPAATRHTVDAVGTAGRGSPSLGSWTMGAVAASTEGPVGVAWVGGVGCSHQKRRWGWTRIDPTAAASVVQPRRCPQAFFVEWHLG